MQSGDGLRTMDQAMRKAIGQALGRVPSGLYVLTAQHEDRRCGMLTSWVQQVCFQPPMLSVAVAKGRMIMPLISESRQFGLCQLAEDDRPMIRKFTSQQGNNDDPFLGHELVRGILPDVPILAHTMAYFECELTCHMDVEGDHDLFVGKVKAGAVRQGDRRPYVHVREDGFDY